MVGQLVLDLNVLPSCEFGEKAQFLKNVTERALSQQGPLRRAERADVSTVKNDLSLVVVAIANEVAAERRLARARSGLNQIELAPFQLHVLEPDLRTYVRAANKNLWNGLLKNNLIQELNRCMIMKCVDEN